MPVKIYYVDDEPDLCVVVRLALESPEVIVETFVDPEVAILRIAKEPPDLLLLDFRMPQTTGIKVASRVAASIPKVLVTGDLEVASIEGFMDVLYKPLDFEAMERLIDGVLRRRAAG